MKNLSELIKKTTILGLILGLFSISSVYAQNEANYYGEKISEKGAVSTTKLEKLMNEKESVNVKLKGEIIQTCSKKGCWMSMDMGKGQKMLVKFKDYGFFVPKEGVNGKTAIIEGIAQKEVIDVATLRHYAEDAGKSKEEIEKITQPEEKFTFEAVGVIIK